jgi:hypothetical protein
VRFGTTEYRDKCVRAIGDTGAVNQLDVVTVAVRRVRNVFLHAPYEVGVDLVDDAQGKSERAPGNTRRHRR